MILLTEIVNKIRREGKVCLAIEQSLFQSKVTKLRSDLISDHQCGMKRRGTIVSVPTNLLIENSKEKDLVEGLDCKGVRIYIDL